MSLSRLAAIFIRPQAQSSIRPAATELLQVFGRRGYRWGLSAHYEATRLSH